MTHDESWEVVFRERLPTFERLANEAVFTLRSAVEAAGIKTHSIESRVKTRESLRQKAKDKEVDDPLSEIDDVVGVRVVVLFLSDLPRLDKVIQSSFAVVSTEDKIADGDPSSFGYMSTHYVAELASGHIGPRYDPLKGILIEIQTRTVVMDAWANISHYLDYKGESSVPSDLRKDFYALSGLFYVADQHFELFAAQTKQSQKQAEGELDDKSTAHIEINLDTFTAFLSKRYPDRERPTRGSISDLVEEVVGAGYSDLRSLERDLDGVSGQFEQRERDRPPGTVHDRERFNPVGVVRVSLRILGKLPEHPDLG